MGPYIKNPTVWSGPDRGLGQGGAMAQVGPGLAKAGHCHGHCPWPLPALPAVANQRWPWLANASPCGQTEVKATVGFLIYGFINIW